MKNISLRASCFMKMELDWLPCNEEACGGCDLNGNAPEEKVTNMLNHIMQQNSCSIPGIENMNADEAYERLLDAMHRYLLNMEGNMVFTDDNGDRIFTGCCFGLEAWKKTVDELNKGVSPWMGHDPFVNLQIVDSKWIISNRSESNSFPNRKDIDICYDEEEFKSLLAKLEKEFEEFVYGPLRSAVSKIWPAHEDEFCEAFYEQFTQLDLMSKRESFIDEC